MECLTENELAEYIHGVLSANALDRVERHLDGCADCHDLFAQLAAAEEPVSDSLEDTIPDAPRALAAGPAYVSGDTVGRYVLGERLGAGAMGVVYLAHDPMLGREVALKLLRPEGWSALDAELVTGRLLREAKALAKLAHPNVVAVHDVGWHQGQLFIAMALVRGTTLGQWLRQGRRSWQETLAVLLRAARGLAAAHGAGLVHRDFKPANVLVGADGRVCVTDFGLARDAETRGEEGLMVGSPGYMAPEQMRGEAVDARADQYSFCATLYEAVFGVRPYRAKDLGALRAKVEKGELDFPSTVRIPRGLTHVIARGLRPDPADRYPNMDALIGRLERERLHAQIGSFENVLEDALQLTRSDQTQFVPLAMRLLSDFLDEVRRQDDPDAAVALTATGEAIALLPGDYTLESLARIEVIGLAVVVVLEAFGSARSLAAHYLMKHGIGAIGPDGQPRFEPKSFYPILPFLDLLRRVERDVGKAMVFELGQSVVRFFPRDPTTSDIRSALQKVDRTAHLSLRRDGEPMLRPDGTIVEGFGHVRAVEVRDRSATLAYTAPLTCEFERGALQAEMRRFEPSAEAFHERTPQTCRKSGAPACLFRVTW